MLSPLPRCSKIGLRCCSDLPVCISLPRSHCRVGPHIFLFEDCSAFTHVTACTLARSPKVWPLSEGFRTFCYLHACSGCFRLERSPGGACTHWKSAALSRRTWEAEVEPHRLRNDLSGKAVAAVQRITSNLRHDCPIAEIPHLSVNFTVPPTKRHHSTLTRIIFCPYTNPAP